MTWATEAGDEVMVAYTLTRQADQAADRRDAAAAVGLAQAALRRPIPARVRAVAFQQQAHGHAIAGEEAATFRALDHALEEAPRATRGRAATAHRATSRCSGRLLASLRPRRPAIGAFERELAHSRPCIAATVAANSLVVERLRLGRTNQASNRRRRGPRRRSGDRLQAHPPAADPMSRPLVVWKYAASLDGRIAARDGSSKWITSEESRADVHRLRAELDAIMVGSGTLAADDPSLTVRHVQGRQPLRVVVDSNARTKPTPGQEKLHDLMRRRGCTRRSNSATALSGDQGRARHLDCPYS